MQCIRKFLQSVMCAVLLGLGLAPQAVPASNKKAVLLGLDAEFGLANSASAQAIEMGMRIAITQINQKGGVLDGRPLQLVTRDNRSIPARGVRNLTDFSVMPDLVAVFGGRFSPVIMEQIPLIHKIGMPFMVVWASADPLTDHGMEPNYVFRLSLRDSLAMPRMLAHARSQGFSKVGLLLPNSTWGRSNLSAAEKNLKAHNADNMPQATHTVWYYQEENSFVDHYLELLHSGAQAIVLVANNTEAAILVREIAALPDDQRLPIISHWGITGGDFLLQAGPAMDKVELAVIQSFSFTQGHPAILPGFLQILAQLYDIHHIDRIPAPVGVAQAYDMTHIVARAIELAGSTDRAAIRDAMERLPEYQGLIRLYKPPFTRTRHDALGPEQLLMARYRKDGFLIPIKD